MKNKNKKKKNRRAKAFTLIELLAVIVILGLLMAIAIPSVTKYITESRKKTVTTTIGNYIGALTNQVNDMDYVFTDTNTIYAVPIECISLERGGTNPFGKWHQASNSYWAYVLVQYDDSSSSYTYGFTFKDSAGYGIYPTSTEKLNENGKQIQTGLSLNRPEDGVYTKLTAEENWGNSGFILNETTQINVLEATSEGDTGDGKDTCTLCQKGDNYDAVEEEKAEHAEALEATEGTLINNGSSSAMVFGKSLNRSTIESITLLDNKKVPKGAIEWWDASQEQNLSIKAWILDEDADGKYELYIGQKDGVTAPVNSSYLFYGYSNATLVDVSKLNTSNVTDMSYMFALNAAKSLDLSNFNTSKVTNMMAMFSLASNVEALDISSFDTGNVTNMQGMFGFIQKIKSINLNHFNTSKVTNMIGMFANTKFETINLSGWNTSNVTTMQNMFGGSNQLTSLNLSHFNTAKVTNMQDMFWACKSLKTLNISNFNTSKVTTMEDMFWATESLTTLNLSSFNTSNVTNMANMFRESAIGTLTLGSNFNTSKVTNMSWMFYQSPNINTTITIRKQTASSIDLIFVDAATSSTARINYYTDSTSYNAVTEAATIARNINSNVKLTYKGRVS